MAGGPRAHMCECMRRTGGGRWGVQSACSRRQEGRRAHGELAPAAPGGALHAARLLLAWHGMAWLACPRRGCAAAALRAATCQLAMSLLMPPPALTSVPQVRLVVTTTVDDVTHG